MAFWVLMLMLILMFVVFFWFIVKKKPIKKLLLSFVGVLVGYLLLVDFACGPNSHDVKIMKPQAKAIADYIVKNGIPKSLEDIPDLPYALVECESNGIRSEKCYFYFENSKYNVNMHYRTYALSLGFFNPSKRSRTGIHVSFTDENNTHDWVLENRQGVYRIYSSKSSGICKTFRQ